MKIWYWQVCRGASRQSILKSVAYIANRELSMQVIGCATLPVRHAK